LFVDVGVDSLSSSFSEGDVSGVELHLGQSTVKMGTGKTEISSRATEAKCVTEELWLMLAGRDEL